MFEAISLTTQNKHDTKCPIDIGGLVECMLFYERVTIIANYTILAQLIRYFGVDRLLTIIEEELLNIVYTESYVGIHTRTENNTQFHDVIEFSSPQHTYQDELRKICINVTGKTGKGRRAAQRIQDKIHVTGHDHIILEGTRKSILDQDYLTAATKIVIGELVPEAGDISKISFNTEKTPKGIVVATNINFVALNELYHRRVPPEHSSISPALILSHLLDVEKELFFASSNLSELASSNLSAKLAEQKIDYVLSRSAKSNEELTHFEEFVFNDAKSIREAINSNQINLDELISVLQNSKQFKKWIVGIKPDADIVKSYYEEVTRKSGVDKLPGKSVRWVVFTGLGLAADAVATGGFGVIAGLALGALNTFYIDKLISGWKPNQFIEEVKTLIDNGT